MRAGARAPAVALAGAFAAAAATAILYPGWYSSDSAWLLMQARTHAYSSLQPPAMAVAWSGLLELGLAPGSLLVAHLVGLASGLALLAAATRSAVGVLLPLAMLWPPLLVVVGHLWVDVTMAAALALGAGLVAWARSASRPGFAWLAVLPLGYAIASRHNAVAAALPLLFLVVPGIAAGLRGALARAGAALVLALGAMGASALLARHVDAVPMPAWTPVAIWDLSAASVASGRMLLPEGMRGPGLTVEELRPLVNPHTSMDILVGAKSGINPGIDAPLPPAVLRELLLSWAALPFTHPVAWARHRAAVAWSLLGPQPREKVEPLILVPAVVHRAGNPPIAANGTPLNARLVAWARDWRHTALFAPGAYLLLGLAAAALAWRRRPGADRAVVLALVASAWLNAAPLPLIVPAAEFRYLLWSMLACLVASAIALGGLTSSRRA